MMNSAKRVEISCLWPNASLYYIYTPQEFSKPVPTLMSSIYGRKLHLHVDQPDRKHVRIIKTREFLSNNGITFSVAQGYGNVTPV